MHISEGILSGPVLISGALLTASGTAIGLTKITDESLAKVALVTSGLFIASLIQIPLGPSSLHLMLTGLAGALLGWQVFPALLVSLFLQAILFQFGGLTTLGVNVFNLAFPAVISYYFLRLVLSIVGDNKQLAMIAYFLCGSLTIILSTMLLALSLTLSGKQFLHLAQLAVISYLPLVIIEGLITAITLSFINQVKPEMMKGVLK